MKNNLTNKPPSQHNYTGKHQRPENNDDLDSRENEEQDFKKNDTAHNKKDTKAAHLKYRNSPR
jgi:hypothetical protein